MSFRIMGAKLEWLAERERPAIGEALVIPANDHLWMLSGPGLEIKKVAGKSVEIEAVREGPLDPGQIAVTPATALGYRFLVHAVVMTQNMEWVPGAGRRAASAALDRAAKEKLTTLVFYPLYRGVHGRREEPAREMLAGLLERLQIPSSLRLVSVCYDQKEERTLLQDTFLKLLAEAQA